MCVSPLKGICYGVNPETGKKKIKVVKDLYQPSDNENVIPIPCGKCIECRLNHAKVWSDRMMAEASYYTDNVFLTLTYDDAHLPEPLTRFDEETGETFVSPVHPLVKKDVQLFMKRLRKRFPEQKIRFYACGEYGDNSMRPHYHLILFNCRIPDSKLFYKNEDGYSYFISDTLSDLWPFGYHFMAAVNWQTCNYVARYVTKKLVHGYDDLPDKLCYPREFSLMSRKPGIGYQWYQDHKEELVFFDQSYISGEDGSRKIGMNKYFDHLLEVDDLFIYNLLKVERQERARSTNQLYDIDFNLRNRNKELTLQAKTTNIRSRKGGVV